MSFASTEENQERENAYAVQQPLWTAQSPSEPILEGILGLFFGVLILGAIFAIVGLVSIAVDGMPPGLLAGSLLLGAVAAFYMFRRVTRVGKHGFSIFEDRVVIKLNRLARKPLEVEVPIQGLEDLQREGGCVSFRYSSRRFVMGVGRLHAEDVVDHLQR